MTIEPSISGSRLAGKKLLVVGAASGIGKATAQRLAADGGDVALVDVQSAADAAAGCAERGVRAQAWTCDVSDEAAVTTMMAEVVGWLGGLDGVLHVAGIVGDRRSSVDELEQTNWDAVIGVNLTGLYLVAKHAVPHLERTSGVLVLTGSGAGIWNGHTSVAYGASKGGVHGLALTLEGPLRERGIRVYDVAPGAVDTPLLLRPEGRPLDAAERRAAGLTAPEDVAAIMAFLVSDDSMAVRGTIRTW